MRRSPSRLSPSIRLKIPAGWFAALFLAAAVAGCQPYDKHVRLTYVLPAGAGMRSDGRGQTVAVGPFIDGRADRHDIGTITSAGAVPTAHLTADNDVGQWIADALRDELEHDNFAARSDSPGIGSPAAYRITGTVLDCYATADVGYRANVAIQVRVVRTSDNKTILDRQYAGGGGRGSNVQANPNVMGDALREALGDALSQFLADFERNTR